MNTATNLQSRDHIPSSIVNLTLKSAEDIGIDLDPVLKSAGLSGLLGKQKHPTLPVISRSQFAPVWQKCSFALSSYVFGQDGRGLSTYAEDEDWLQSRCAVNCKDLEEVIETQIRFLKVLGDRSGKVSLTCSDREATFVVDNDRRKKTAYAQIIDVVALATFYKMFSWLIAKPLEGLRITLASKQLADLQVLKDIIDFPITFEGEANAIIFNKRMLRSLVVRTYRELTSMVKTMPFELVQLQSSEPVSSHLEKVIRKALETQSSIPDLEQAASLLGQSARSLRRHLAQENESFQRIVEKCRMERAVDLLSTTWMSVDQIALELGFSEYKTFSRAFKKHRGFTPCVFREEQAEEQMLAPA